MVGDAMICANDDSCPSGFFCGGAHCHLRAIAVSGAAYHTCALLIDGTVRCWGRNDAGELGNGTYANATVPVPVSDLADATAISAGGLHTCAIAHGAAFCWGENISGELGTGDNTSRPTPQAIVGLGSVTAISAGAGHTCAVISDGTVRCWGRGLEGQLGDGTMTSSTVPVPVTGLTTAVAVSASSQSACALLSDSTVRCWGNNDYGQLGDGTTTSSPSPVTVVTTTGTFGGVSFLASGGQTACAIATAATVPSDVGVWCWGRNAVSIAGDKVGSLTPTTPIWPQAIGAASVALGISHTCGLSGGIVSCWGDDTYGELGQGMPSMATSFAARTVTELSGVSNLTAGNSFSCAVMMNGSISCWGSNDWGQLGTGNYVQSYQIAPVTAW